MPTPAWMQPSGKGASPIEQLPGDAEPIRRTANAYEEWAERLNETGNAIKLLDTDAWSGPAADAFREKCEFEPKRWFEASDRSTEAAAALYSYADTFEWAQRELVEADAEWLAGYAASKAAAYQSPDPLVGAAWARQELSERLWGSLPKPVIPGDRGAAMRAHALWRRNNAVNQHNEVGDTAARVIDAAADEMPIHRNFLEEVTEFFRGGLDNVDGVIQAATNPARAAQALGQEAKLWTTDPNAAFRNAADLDGLENSPSRWSGSLLLGGAAGRVGKVAKFGGRGHGRHHGRVPPHAEQVRISEERRGHILDGDPDNPTGGGHKPGTGRPGKTEFPLSWDDDKIIQEVLDVAKDPDGQAVSGRFDRWQYIGTRDGVQIKVILEADGSVVSGYPLHGPGVIRNP